MEDCLTCLSNNGIRRISPGETIYSGKYWNVEHAYPSALLGWLVIVLKRHTGKLHELTPAVLRAFSGHSKSGMNFLC